MADAPRTAFPSFGDFSVDPWSPAPLTPAPFTPAPHDPDHPQSHPNLPMFTPAGGGGGGGGGGTGPGGQTGPKHMHDILTMFNRPVQQISPFASTVADQEPPDVSQIVSMYPHMFAPAAAPGSSLPSLNPASLAAAAAAGFPQQQQTSLMEAHQLITKYMQQQQGSIPSPPPSSPFVAPTPRPPGSLSASNHDAGAAALNSLRNVKRPTPDTPSTPSTPLTGPGGVGRGKAAKARKKAADDDEDEDDDDDMPPPKKRGKGGDGKSEEQPRVHKLLKHRAIDAKSRNRLAGAFEALRQIVDVDHKMDKASLLTAATNMITNVQKEWDECKAKLQTEISKRQALEIAITQTPAAGETLSNVRLPNELPLPFFRNLFMDSTVQMVVLNLQRQCVEANDAFLKRHGWTREELIGKVIPSASKLIPAMGNLYDPNLPFDFAPIKAGYPKNMTAAHLNPYPATILGLQKLFTQQEKSVTVVHRFINGRGQLIEGRVTHWLVLDGGKPLYTVGCTTDESVITLLE